ncbi:MAG TPA: cytosine permease, partial [Gaiella sp.]|nr:cytosine permease [Gaiella sp.]
MPEVERYGVEPVPVAERTVGWHDLFAINFTFFLNPVMMVLGALAVLESGLPLLWALVATLVGQALAYLALTIVAQPGVDDGLPGQVAMRASFGGLGARALTSPYRVIASVYWFAAQALTAAFGVQAIAVALADVRPSLVPTALAIAVVQAGVAALGFDVMRWLLRIVLPLSVATAGLLLALWLVSDETDYAVGRVLESPEQELTWVGFATVVTVMCGSSLTLVTNIADLTRYTRSRRDMRIGLVGSTLAATATTTLVGGVYAVGSGETNPFVAASELTSNDAVLSILLLAIVVLTFAANVTNVYTGGLSLVSSLPSLGRVVATALVGVAAIVLSGFPSLIEEAQSWVTHLGNVAAPLTGVVLADYLVRQRGRIEVAALFDPAGRYRYLRGVNVEAVAAVAAGIAVYYAVPDAWVKVAWGAGAGAAVYLALTSVLRPGRRVSRAQRAVLGVTSA